jgi:hypothetical protein
MLVASDRIATSMKKKIVVSLDKEVVAFLDTQAKGNRSKYINDLLTQQRRTELIAALKQNIKDPKYWVEIQAWDCVTEDGLDDTG